MNAVVVEAGRRQTLLVFSRMVFGFILFQEHSMGNAPVVYGFCVNVSPDDAFVNLEWLSASGYSGATCWCRKSSIDCCDGYGS